MPPALTDDPELEARVRARVGTTLRDKYRLDGVLGIGGMAAVYSATHRNGRRVAVKILHPELSWSGEAKTRFLREGLVANTVRHPGVVTILDDDMSEDGAAFLVMEMLEGTTLDDLWERHGRRLPMPAVIAAGIMLLDVLSSAHVAGVVHRDIKPANLFLTHGWELKILDFGISRMNDARSAMATQTGMAMGSPAFMAPEQALGRSDAIDGRTDLWSAAASLYSLASGEFVHEGQTAQEMLIRAATTPVRSLAQVLPGAPALIVAVIDRALSFGMAERWSTASEMAVALSEAARASFGEEPSTGAFASLLPFVPPTAPLTPGLPLRPSSMPPAQALGRPGGSSPSFGRPGSSPALTQLTTTSDPSAAPAVLRRNAVWVVVAATLLGALFGTAVLIGRATRSDDPVANKNAQVGIAPDPRASAPTAPSDAPALRPTEPPAASVSVSAVDVSALPVASGLGVSGSPSRTASPKNASPGRNGGGTKASGGKPSSFLPSSPTNAAPANADPCNPPYRYDFFGNKVAKPGCSL